LWVLGCFGFLFFFSPRGVFFFRVFPAHCWGELSGVVFLFFFFAPLFNPQTFLVFLLSRMGGPKTPNNLFFLFVVVGFFFPVSFFVPPVGLVFEHFFFFYNFLLPPHRGFFPPLSRGRGWFPPPLNFFTTGGFGQPPQ